jgi:FkbM family methyltransferase
MLTGIKNILIRQVYPFGAIRRIRRGPLRGCRYLVAPAMGFTFAWHINGEQWACLAALAKAGDCVYDVGANRGQSTLHLAAAVGPSGRVIAFEPVSAVCDDLNRNLRLNDLNQVTPVNAAASDREGTAEFLFDNNLPTQGKLSAVEPTNSLHAATTQQVRLVRLDDYEAHGWPIPQLIKIDVEGGAGEVLAGAERLIAASSPTLFIELHGPEERAAVKRLLDTHRYVAHTPQGEPVLDPRSASASVLVCRTAPSSVAVASQP